MRHVDSIVRDTWMKPSLRNITLVVALVMLVLGTFVPRFIEKPKDTYKISSYERSIRVSGLPPVERMLLHTLAIGAFVCLLILFVYADKLDNSVACENDIRRLRRYWRAFQYLLFIAASISVARIALAIFALSTIQGIDYRHVFHSWLFAGSTGLFICIWFFLFTRKYIKAVQTVPPSVILAAKRKETS